MEHHADLLSSITQQPVARQKSEICIYSFTIDVGKMASAMGISADRAKIVFGDGRAIAPWVEEWSSLIYPYSLPKNRNNKGFDASLPSRRRMPDDHAGIRVMTKRGSYFDPSKMRGAGRGKSDKDRSGETRREHLNALDFYVVADNTKLPVVRVVLLKTRTIIWWIERKMIGKSFAVSTFYRALNETFSVREEVLSFPITPQE